MPATVDHQATRLSGVRHHVAPDALLFAAVVFVVEVAIQELLAPIVIGAQPPRAEGMPVWAQVLATLSIPVAILAGALLSRRIHGRQLHWRDPLGALIGAVVGALGLALALFLLLSLRRLLPTPSPEEEQGPWWLGILVGVAALAFLTRATLDAVRDLTGERLHPLRDWIRLGSLVFVLAAVMVSLAIGGESAELGLFIALVGGCAAAAATGMEWLDARSLRTSPGVPRGSRGESSGRTVS